jgi:uncharacterized protein YndB with AHSA1/START domain
MPNVVLFGVIASSAGLLLVIWFIGCLLPKQRKAEKVVEFGASPEHVWEIITDMGRQAEWRPSVKRVEIQSDGERLASWVEYPKSGSPIYFKATIWRKPSRLEFAFTDRKVFNGYWVGEFQSLPDRGTRLAITETAEITQPNMRVLSFLFFDMDRSIEDYLGEVKNRLGEKD